MLKIESPPYQKSNLHFLQILSVIDVCFCRHSTTLLSAVRHLDFSGHGSVDQGGLVLFELFDHLRLYGYGPVYFGGLGQDVVDNDFLFANRR